MKIVVNLFKNNIGIYKKDCLKAIFFALIECLFVALIPLFTGKFMDLGIERHDIEKIIIYSILVLLSSFLYLLFGVVSVKCAVKGAYGFANNLRANVFNKIINFSFKNQNKFTIGELMNRSTKDIYVTTNCFIALIRFALVAIITLIFSIILIFKIDINVSKVFIYVYPFIILIMIYLSFKTIPVLFRTMKLSDELNNRLIESIEANKLIKSLHKEKYEIEKFSKINSKYFNANIKSKWMFGLSTPICDFAKFGVTLLIAWIGAKYIVISNNDPELGFTMGNLTSLMTYAGLLHMGISQVLMMGIMLVSGFIFMKRIENILEIDNEIEDLGKNDLKLQDGSIEFRNVNFSYYDNNNFILKNINFKINSGEIVGIFGKTSSGKSSIVNLIPRFYDTNSGEIIISGKNIKEYSLETLHKGIGFVFQKSNLFKGTILDNVKMFDDNIDDEIVKKSCEIAVADIFINEKKNKYNEDIIEGGMNLSGGQRQRLTIARAIAKCPKILILDDSFSAVDSKTAIKIKNNLKKELKGTTIIIISDRINSLSDVDKVIYIDDGEIVKIGKYEEIFEKV